MLFLAAACDSSFSTREQHVICCIHRVQKRRAAEKSGFTLHGLERSKKVMQVRVDMAQGWLHEQTCAFIVESESH